MKKAYLPVLLCGFLVVYWWWSALHPYSELNLPGFFLAHFLLALSIWLSVQNAHHRGKVFMICGLFFVIYGIFMAHLMIPGGIEGCGYYAFVIPIYLVILGGVFIMLAYSSLNSERKRGIKAKLKLLKFLKPDWRKIIIFILISVLSFTVFYVGYGNRCSCFCLWTKTCPSNCCYCDHPFLLLFWLPYFLVSGTHRNLLPTPAKIFKYIDYIPESIASVAYWYFLSCLIILVWDKFKTKK